MQNLTLSEEKFKNWLNHQNISWYFIDQSPETFAESFSMIIKRPDFVIQLPYKRNIYVDVKSKRIYPKYGNFTIGNNEIQKLLK